jgi:hypothetical protein
VGLTGSGPNVGVGLTGAGSVVGDTSAATSSVAVGIGVIIGGIGVEVDMLSVTTVSRPAATNVSASMPGPTCKRWTTTLAATNKVRMMAALRPNTAISVSDTGRRA